MKIIKTTFLIEYLIKEMDAQCCGSISCTCGSISCRCGTISRGCGTISRTCGTVSVGCGTVSGCCGAVSVGCDARAPDGTACLSSPGDGRSREASSDSRKKAPK